MTLLERPAAAERSGEPGGIVRFALGHFDRLFDGVVGVFGILFALQSADSFVVDLPSLDDPLGKVLLGLLSLAVVSGLWSLVLPTHARAVFTTGAGLYVVALLLWPLAMRPPVPMGTMPLVVGLWPVAAANLTHATRSRVAPVAIGAACSVFAVLTLHLRGGLSLADAMIDGLFMLGFTVILVLLLGTVRRGLTAVATQQQAALDTFAAATAEDATEQERRRTDALLHDAVLTTFLSAASASTPEAEDLVTRMAANSLRVLMHVNGVGRDEAAMPFGRAVADQRDRLAALAAAFDEVDLDRAEPVMLPETVAHAAVAVLIEAMADSLEHARDVSHRSVHGDRLGADGIRIAVSDDAGHVDPDLVHDRWSVDGGRESVARLRAVEGRVDAHADESGTSVQLSWGSAVMVGTTPLPATQQAGSP